MDQQLAHPLPRPLLAPALLDRASELLHKTYLFFLQNPTGGPQKQQESQTIWHCSPAMGAAPARVWPRLICHLHHPSCGASCSASGVSQTRPHSWTAPESRKPRKTQQCQKRTCNQENSPKYKQPKLFLPTENISEQQRYLYVHVHGTDPITPSGRKTRFTFQCGGSGNSYVVPSGMVYPLAHLQTALTSHTPAAGALQGGGLNPHPHPLWISDIGTHLIHFGSGAIILFVQVLVVLSGLLNMNNNRE